MKIHFVGCRRGSISIASRLIAVLGAAAFLTAMTASVASAAGPERSLAGIRIFSKSDQLFKKFGNPDEIRVGDQSNPLLGTGEVSIGNPASGAGNGTVAPLSGGGGSEFGIGGRPAQGGQPEATDTGGGAQGQTYVYDRSDGTSLEFTLTSDGRVIQIRATGYKSASYKTARGVVLGMSLAEVQQRYGFPEATNYSANRKFLNLNYSQKYHAAFTFINQGGVYRVVGIIVAAVD